MTQICAKVPGTRIRRCNDRPVRAGGAFVLYWMTANRRTRFNFALQRSLELARELGKPLLVLEALRCDYPYASERLHASVLDGMADQREAFERAGVAYYPFVEGHQGEGKGLLEALGRSANCVVTDDSPAFFLPRMIEAAARKLDVALEAVDSVGLLPLRATPDVFPTAYAFRRFLQRSLLEHLGALPEKEPLRRARGLPRATLPVEVLERWPAATEGALAGDGLASLPIAHGVGRAGPPGGQNEGSGRVRRFVAEGLGPYPEDRNKPELEATSGLSPYLHFGHVSAHEVFQAVAESEDWSPEHTARRASGSREGWWGMGPAAEAFLDQLVTWRELGHNAAAHMPAYATFGSLPEWALRTLHKHASDPRPHRYSPQALEAARTHDPLWNAAQRQLVREGRLHNYLRMLWGKKILEWSSSPKEALDVMLRLNDTYALDGRDPNSVSGVFWCLGRYDRPWGPERSIFGTVRYMSSENTARKVRVGDYLRRYAE
jgi:deoxyribodipyrimidine photo-lyase